MCFCCGCQLFFLLVKPVCCCGCRLLPQVSSILFSSSASSSVLRDAVLSGLKYFFLGNKGELIWFLLSRRNQATTMASCKPEGGYESPAVGVWGIGLTMQIVSAFILLCLASSLSSFEKHFLPDHLPDPQIPLMKTSVFAGLGVAQLIAALVVGVMVFLGYFITSWLLVFSCVLGWICKLLSVANAVVSGIMLTNISKKQGDMLYIIRNAPLSPAGPGRVNNPMPLSSGQLVGIRSDEQAIEDISFDYSSNFGFAYTGMILAFGVLSLGSLIPLTRADYMGPKARAIDGMVHIYALTLCGVLGSFFLLLSDALNKYITLGILWLVIGAVLVVALSMQRMCWPRILSILLALLFVLSSAFSVVSLVVCVNRFLDYHTFLAKQASVPSTDIVPWIRGLDDDDFHTLELGYKSSDFAYFLIAACLSVATLIYFIAGAMASLRSIFGPSRSEKLMSRDSAHEAIESRVDNDGNRNN